LTLWARRRVGANIERDVTHIGQVGSLSAARGWIREQTGKQRVA
jgi:hypothetical protein